MPQEEEEEELLLVPMPSLVATLMNKEQEKGEPLTEDEVLEIRDNCPCTAMPAYALAKVAEARGYDDIDPENAWEEWLAIRPSLYGADDAKDSPDF